MKNPENLDEDESLEVPINKGPCKSFAKAFQFPSFIRNPDFHLGTWQRYAALADFAGTCPPMFRFGFQ